MSFSQSVLHGVLWSREENAVTLPHSAHKKHAFLGGIKEMSKTKKLPSREKIDLELLHQKLGHKFTISLLAWDTANVLEDIELRIYPDLFCKSCQMSPMNKKARSKVPLKPKEPIQLSFYGYNSIKSTQTFFLTIF